MPNNQDLYFSHVTMFAYHQMLRVIKLYKFGYGKQMGKIRMKMKSFN